MKIGSRILDPLVLEVLLVVGNLSSIAVIYSSAVDCIFTVMDLSSLRRLVRSILSEEIGRNFHTVNTEPISYKDFAGYEVDIITTVDGSYILNIFHGEKKLVPSRKYNTREEAELHARQIVEKHRLSQ